MSHRILGTLALLMVVLCAPAAATSNVALAALRASAPASSVATASSSALPAHAGTCPAGFSSERVAGGLATSSSCRRLGGPEPLAEGLAAEAYAGLRENGLNLPVAAGALAAGVTQRALVNATGTAVAGSTAAWTPIGQSPLHNDSTDPVYNLTAPQTTVGSLSALGYPQISGRLNDFAYDPATPGRYFAATAGGGAWETRDGGGSWHAISSALADGALGAIAYTSAGGGTLIVGSGDPVKVFSLGTAASGSPNVASAIDLRGDNAYAGFCGYCATVVGRFSGTPFANGIATNVGGSAPPQRLTPNGWHFAKAAGLPQRFITSIRMDPVFPRTVYVTLGGYSVPWYPPGATLESTAKIGSGHVFKSTDAGETFVDITGDLPDVPTNSTAIHNGQLVVANELGVFIASGTDGGHYGVLGTNLPGVRVYSLRFKPADPDLMIAATFGRGVWQYVFPPSASSGGGSTAPLMLPLTGTAGPAQSIFLLGLAAIAWLLPRRPRPRVGPGARSDHAAP